MLDGFRRFKHGQYEWTEGRYNIQFQHVINTTTESQRCWEAAVLYIFMFSLIYCMSNIKIELYSLCVNCLGNDVFCYRVNVLGPQMFSFFLMFRDSGARQEKVHWKVRWVDQPDFGHFVLFSFAESSICICLRYFLAQFAKNPHLLVWST